MRHGTLDFTFASPQNTNRSAQIGQVSAGACNRPASAAPAASYNHYTLIFGGNVQEETERNGAPIGPALMGFKCWASSQDQAMKLAELFSKEFSFIATGVQFLESKPAKPPCAIPFGYDFRITPSQFAVMIC